MRSEQADRPAHRKVQDKYDEKQSERRVGGRDAVRVDDLTRDLRRLDHLDHHDQRRGLDHPRDEVDGQRHQTANRLGDDNTEIGLGTVHSQRVGALILVYRDTLQSPPNEITHLSGTPEGEHDHRGEFGLEF